MIDWYTKTHIILIHAIGRIYQFGNNMSYYCKIPNFFLMKTNESKRTNSSKSRNTYHAFRQVVYWLAIPTLLNEELRWVSLLSLRLWEANFLWVKVFGCGTRTSSHLLLWISYHQASERVNPQENILPRTQLPLS